MEAIDKVIEILKKLGLSEELLSKVQEELTKNAPESEGVEVKVEVSKDGSEEKDKEDMPMDKKDMPMDGEKPTEDATSIEKRLQDAMPRF